MNYYLFRLIDGISLENVRTELEKKGLKDLFVIEDDALGEILIGGHAKKRIESQNVTLVEEKEAKVNWEEQWALFAENFHEGKAHIQLGDQTLLLNPGAGFGDLSHPTTALMLQMMEKLVKDESVIDIGSGSGILTLAAHLLGANKAIGIEIDLDALKHAKENAKLNHLPVKFYKALPQKIEKKNVILMNMIIPEQIAFNPSRLNKMAKYWIISGVLKSQRNEYLKITHEWGWKHVFEEEKLEWLGFIFC